MRHAESENVTGGVAGVVPTAPLTAAGREQALAVARDLAGEPVTAIYASTALRARQTAAPLADVYGVDVGALPELAEVGIGAHEGTNDPAIFTRWASVLRSWVVDGDLTRRLGDGESGHEVVARVGGALRRIADAHPGATAVVVGHVASLTVMVAQLCGLGASVWGRPLAHAHPFAVDWNGAAWHCPAWPPRR